ncbi:MAG: nitronate monooxygenase [Desulfobacterales bacterium]|nr:nitronate monooxygenase [Desulfobacterales bacterium]
MVETELTRRLGLKYPLIGGAMMSITTPEFVAAVSNAGGMGILASTIYKTPEDFEDALDTTLALTDKPFAVNLSMFPAIRPVDNNLYLDIMKAKGVGIVETSGHSAPTELSKRFRESGMVWLHKCVGPRYARKVEGLGADFVTVVGYENGGATGNYDIATMVLIPVVRDAVAIPVIGGGGISDGRGVSAALCLGACGVIMGTRLLATEECPIHENIKQVLLNTSEIDTRLVMRSINATHRVLANPAAERCLELEAEGADFNRILDVVSGLKAKSMYDKGDVAEGIIACGQGIGLVRDVPTVRDLFDRIMEETAETFVRMNGTLAN